MAHPLAVDLRPPFTRARGATAPVDRSVPASPQDTGAQLVDAVHRIGYFNFIHRVLDGLGVDPEPGMRYASVPG